MSANTISALFLLCTGYAVWKRDCCILCRHLSVQYLMSFLFTSLLPFSFSIPLLHSEVGGCSTIVLIVVRYMNEFEWSCMFVWKGARTIQCVSCMQCFYFWAYTNWGQEFGKVALMEIPKCTQLPRETTAAKLSTTAGEWRLVHRSDLLTFTHGRPFKCRHFFNNHDQ